MPDYSGKTSLVRRHQTPSLIIDDTSKSKPVCARSGFQFGCADLTIILLIISMVRLLSFGFAFDIDYFRVSYFIQWYNLCDGATDLETDMNTVIKLNPLVYEFDSESEADTYSKWLENEIAQARRAPVISNEEATNRLDANRARLLEKLKNAR